MSPASGNRRALMSELSRLVSEERNPGTMDIDLMSTTEILTTINREDRTVAEAVSRVIPEVVKAVDAIVATFERGGRLVYIGAGTSGRLGVLDASECPPTFGVPYGMVVGLIAGGPDALTNAAEGAEDNVAQGAADLDAIKFSSRDIVVASPFPVGRPMSSARSTAPRLSVRRQSP